MELRVVTTWKSNPPVATVELQLHFSQTKVKQPPMRNPSPRTMAHPSPPLSLSLLLARWWRICNDKQTTIKLRYRGDRSIGSWPTTHTQYLLREISDKAATNLERRFHCRETYTQLCYSCSLDRDNRGSCADAAFRHQGRHQIQCGFRFWWWVPKLNASKMELGTVAHATNHEVYALRVMVIMMVMVSEQVKS